MSPLPPAPSTTCTGFHFSGRRSCGEAGNAPWVLGDAYGELHYMFLIVDDIPLVAFQRRQQAAAMKPLVPTTAYRQAGARDARFGCLSGACFAALLTLVAGCSEPAAQNGKRDPAGTGPVNVVTVAVTRQPMGLEIEAIGTAFANESVEVTSKVSNTVTAIRFDEGQAVRRGSVLVELDTAQARADLAVAEAAQAESQSQYDRSRNLFSTQVLSKSELDQIEATHKANLARVAAAQARLSDNVIRAPFDGRTGFRRVSLGSLVNPGTVITTLDDSSIIKLDFTVPQSFMFAVKRDLPVMASISGLADRKFEGRVTTLGSRIDPVTRSITVRAELPNQEGVLRPGMFMTVRLNAEVTDALLIPEQALVPEQGRTFVFVVEDGVASKREISIGRRRPGEVEVTIGLAERERVIVDGTQKVRDQSRVQEVGPGGPAAS